MRKLCLTILWAALALPLACSDAPADSKADAETNKQPVLEEFDGKMIRIVGKHHYVAKSAEGTAIWYYKSGKKRTARTFVQGKLQGPMVMWYEDGSKMYAVNYVDNKKQGQAKGWYPDGKPRFVVEYDSGMRFGTEIWYWENEQKKIERTWYRGQVTAAKAWSKDGKQIPVPTRPTRQPIRQPGSSKGGSSKSSKGNSSSK